MTIHNLKIIPKYFSDVLFGTKTFELRKNDREFAEGDLLVLHEFDTNTGYTGQTVSKEINYIFTDSKYGLQEGYVILGLI